MSNRKTTTVSLSPLGRRAFRRKIFWHQLQQRHFSSLEEIRAFQLHELQSLVKYAYNFVPFYRKRFDHIGLVPEDIKTLKDYARIPILTRQDIVDNLPQMWSREFREDQLLYLATGGSTGVPMNYYKDLNYIDRAQIVLARSQSWAGKKRNELLVSFVTKREPPGVRGEIKRRLRAWTEHKLYFDTFDAHPNDFDEWMKIIWRYRPVFVYGYPSFLEIFARWLLERQLELPFLKGVIVSAETLNHYQRNIIQEVFAAPIFNFYGSREVMNISATCTHQNMHQIADSVFTEFVSENDLPAPRLVLTPLDSLGMPLIRYTNDDLGSPVERSCPCGLVFPLMNLNIARVVDVFVTPEGKWMYGQFFTHLMYGICGVQQFEFHQLRPDFIRLSIVKDKNFDTESEEKLVKVVNEIHSEASPAIQVEIKYVDRIDRTAVGKYIFTRSDVLTNRMIEEKKPKPISKPGSVYSGN